MEWTKEGFLVSGKRCCLPLMHRGGVKVWGGWCWWLTGSCTIVSEEQSQGLPLHFLFLAQTQRSQWESFLLLGTVVSAESGQEQQGHSRNLEVSKENGLLCPQPLLLMRMVYWMLAASLPLYQEWKWNHSAFPCFISALNGKRKCRQDFVREGMQQKVNERKLILYPILHGFSPAVGVTVLKILLFYKT